MKRVTHRDLAAALGLSVSAISLALRRHASIPLATQGRVIEKAKELGYQHDARVAQHMAYIRSRRKHDRLLPLAYVHNFEAPLKELSHEAFQSAFAAADERAKELGYYLEEFWVNETDMSYRRLQQILESRNFDGIYLHVSSEQFPDMNVDRFSVVANGPPFRDPKVHSVFPDAVYNFDLMFKKIIVSGYTAIGVCLWGKYGNEVYRSILPKTLSYLKELYPSLRPIPMLHLESGELEGRKDARGWVEEWQPEVIISNDLQPFMIEDDERTRRELVSWDTSSRRSPNLSGIDRNLERIAQVTVEQIIGMINRNEKGTPKDPHSIQVKGSWVDGCTFRPRI